ncbi:MAG: AMIN domain-containing protein [Desulfocapsaceae bacterium]
MKQLFSIAIFCILSFLFSVIVANAQSQSSQPTIASISVTAGAGGEEQLVFKLSGSYAPKVFRLDGERPRLVFDFANTLYRGEKTQIEGNGGWVIDGVRIGRHTQPVKTRVVVDIVQNADYQYDQTFNVSNNSLIITFFPNEGGEPDKQTAATAGPQYIRLESKKIVHQPQPPPAPPAVPVASEKDTPADLTATTPVTPQASEQVPEAVPQPVAPIEKPIAPAATPPAPVAAIAAEQKKQVMPVDEEPAAAAETESSPTQKPASAAEAQIPEPAEVESAQNIATPALPEAEAAPLLLDVAFEKSANKSETVLFRLNNFFPPLVFGIEQGEPQVVCDFLDARLGPEVADSIQASGDFISRIEVVSESDPEKVRVTLTLVPNRHYDLQQLFFKEDNLFVIIVSELQDAASNGVN